MAPRFHGGSANFPRTPDKKNFCRVCRVSARRVENNPERDFVFGIIYWRKVKIRLKEKSGKGSGEASPIPELFSLATLSQGARVSPLSSSGFGIRRSVSSREFDVHGEKGCAGFGNLTNKYK